MNSRPSVDSTIQNSNIKIFANLQRLLINIFMTSKKVTLWLQKAQVIQSQIFVKELLLWKETKPSAIIHQVSFKAIVEASLVVQWLRIHLSMQGTGLIPDQGTKIPPAVGQLSLCSTAILSLLSTACDLWQQAAAMQSLHTTTSEQSSLTATGEISLTALKNPCAATKTQHSHINK